MWVYVTFDGNYEYLLKVKFGKKLFLTLLPGQKSPEWSEKINTTRFCWQPSKEYFKKNKSSEFWFAIQMHKEEFPEIKINALDLEVIDRADKTKLMLWNIAINKVFL